MLTQCDPDYGKRIAEGIKMAGKNADSKMEEAVKQAKEMGYPSDSY
jgi:catalase